MAIVNTVSLESNKQIKINFNGGNLSSGRNFNRREFKAFFALYSNGTVWPKIWEHKSKEKYNET